MNPSPRSPRRNVLPHPRLQLRLVLAFLCAAGIASIVQTLLLARTLGKVAETLPEAGDQLLAQLPQILGDQVLVGFLLMAPLMLAVGVLETFRVVGPLRRIESYLRALHAGERPGPCRIRKGDDLQDLCELVNDATEPLREAGREGVGGAARAPVEEPPSLVEAPETARKASQAG